jgi:two-component system response regulator MprA
MKVLVVDDDSDVTEYMSSFLEDEGYEVEMAGDSEAALSVMGPFRPDAVLIDVMLPGRSGLDLLVNLRRSAEWTDIPLVLVTGDDAVLKDDCRSYLESHRDVRGPDHVLGKPMDRDRLLAVLKEIGIPSAAE